MGTPNSPYAECFRIGAVSTFEVRIQIRLIEVPLYTEGILRMKLSPQPSGSRGRGAFSLIDQEVCDFKDTLPLTDGKRFKTP